ncbi:MAG: hypothetical protein IJV04_08475 [Lachnospiraceae bacterium]|nr:hypothetical protein [Lachnospiraceae bacterium]
MDNQAISFADEIGMFAILQRSDPENKVFRELIRYDQVGSYERYEETEEENGQTRLRERGIKLHLLSPLDAGHLDADKAKKGLRAHPYIRHEIKVVFAKADKGGADYTINAIAHFDHIFGAHDNDTALFSFKGSKQQQRNFAAQKDLSDLIGGAIKAARSGQAEPDEALAAQFEKTQASMASANTGGMSVYSKRADDAEHQVSR